MKIFNKQKGFSLIELLIYIAILISAVTIVAVFTVDIIKANRAEQGNRDTQQNARFIIERLQYETRWANDIATPYQTDEMILETSSGNVRFYLNTGDNGQTAMFIERDGSSQQLTSSQVEVSQFELQTIDPANGPPSVRVELTVDDTALDNVSSTDIDTIISVREN
ncbi:PilW family protein [Patescibacteria group bacterium]